MTFLAFRFAQPKRIVVLLNVRSVLHSTVSVYKRAVALKFSVPKEEKRKTKQRN